MIATVIHDVSGWDFGGVPMLALIVMVFSVALPMSAISVKTRESMSWSSFYVIWLFPMMSVWVVFLLIRGAILMTWGLE
jgi:hypothetical protein